VAEFKRSRKHPARAVAASRRGVLAIPHPDTSNHNGGQLQFGPDGYLYIGTGDGGRNADSAANLDVLLGKLLRIDPRKRHGRHYTVPSRNPYVGGGHGRAEIYAYGLRNPWRFSFDSTNGRLAIADVGAGSREEVNYVTRAGAKGANFGWPQWEGDQPHSGDPGPDAPTFPIFTYPHPDGCAVVGGYVVRGPGLPALAGRYVYTDLCHGDIRSFVPDLGGASDDQSTGLQVSSPTSFGVGAGGQIYVASYGGDVFRLRASP
jgi:glucose/arabinose dehydrogenase